ncbi:MAG TPA: COX15/CtaA family protein [Candidatus Nanopelagicaceae bacterium]
MNFVSLIYTTLVVLQVGLVLTGGAVRLTGSGLGCPTWPECFKGSIAPIPHPAQGQLHSWIEYGNRLLTILLVLTIMAAVFGAFRWGKGLRDWKMIRLLALTQAAGIVAQIVLGGITVLTKLNPFAVSAHFLLSMVLIAGSLSLRERIFAKARTIVLPTTKLLIQILVLLSAVVITLGTIVTGSGPHAGDIQAKRYHIDPRIISWAHADTVVALISLTIGLWLVIKVSESPEIRSFIGKKVLLFFAICLAQGLIGYIQYFTHLPEALVAAHLLGAGLMWLTIWNIGFKAEVFSRQ